MPPAHIARAQASFKPGACSARHDTGDDDDHDGADGRRYDLADQHIADRQGDIGERQQPAAHQGADPADQVPQKPPAAEYETRQPAGDKADAKEDQKLIGHAIPSSISTQSPLRLAERMVACTMAKDLRLSRPELNRAGIVPVSITLAIAESVPARSV